MLFLLNFLPARDNGPEQDEPNRIISKLTIVDIDSKKISLVLRIKKHIEAPNWSKDGKYLIVNSGGLLYRVPLASPALKPIPTGFADQCNNDHGLSPDGKTLAISHNKPVDGGRSSSVYTMPATGGTPVEVTRQTPSYWHGWSADGKTLAYCAERNGNFDVYSIPITGGKETRLTSDKGLDDGPDYSADGKYIYYNSYASGSMQIWRMKTDGTDKIRLTNDEYSNWFAHPSQDGKWLVYIAYLQNQGQQHPFGKDVKLRLMRLSDQSITDLTPTFFGGQGTINVPSWRADSKHLAFVSYEMDN